MARVRALRRQEGTDDGEELGGFLDHGPLAAAGQDVQASVRQQVDELGGRDAPGDEAVVTVPGPS
jgi:hypothetical protein